LIEDENISKFSYFSVFALDENKRIKIYIMCNKSLVKDYDKVKDLWMEIIAPFHGSIDDKKDAFIYSPLDDFNLVPQYTTNSILHGFNTHRLKDKELLDKLIRILGEETNLISGLGDVKEILKEFKLNQFKLYEYHLNQYKYDKFYLNLFRFNKFYFIIKPEEFLND